MAVIDHRSRAGQRRRQRHRLVEPHAVLRAALSAGRDRRGHHGRSSWLTALFADVIAPFDPTSRPTPASRWRRPGGEHWLGADFMGRDVFSRIVYGARISLAVGVGATALGCLIGVTIGLMSRLSSAAGSTCSCSA